MSRLRSFAIIAALAGCVARDDDETSQGETSTADTSTTTSGSGPIEPEDCAAFTTRTECEAAEVIAGGYAQCVWVAVLTPDPECAPLAAPTERCIGVSGADPGCAPLDCPEGSVNAFHRTARSGIEVFVNPTCGLEPAGWTRCTEGESPPPECVCACSE